MLTLSKNKNDRALSQPASLKASALTTDRCQQKNNSQMNKYVALIILCLLFTSFKIDLDGPWVETQKENVILYTRPYGYSKTPSPDSMDINIILDNQTDKYDEIDSFLKTNFKFLVKIYLYNYDEAKEKIGTNTGGGANTKLREIYFTFDTAIMRIKENDLLGKHELTHIIASNELSYPATILMNEGYANALSKVYAGKTLEFGMKFHKKKGNILTPTEMLEIKKFNEFIFYPQAGYFVNWLFENYGVENVNKLYPLKARKIKKEIFLLTGKEFSQIEKDYLMNIDNME
jgi:hypothetical protein